jgi:uncharacterized RmlC-like cupin family protein
VKIDNQTTIVWSGRFTTMTDNGRIERRMPVPLGEAGDFVYIKPGMPHEVFNMSDTESVVAFVARSSPKFLRSNSYFLLFVALSLRPSSFLNSN